MEFLSARKTRELNLAIDRGLSALVKSQDQAAGCWQYGNNVQMRHYYTAIVMHHVDSLQQLYPEAWDAGLRFLQGACVGSSQGLPEYLGGEIDLAQTALYAALLSKSAGKEAGLARVSSFLNDALHNQSLNTPWHSLTGMRCLEIERGRGDLATCVVQLDQLVEELQWSERKYGLTDDRVRDLLPEDLKHLVLPILSIADAPF